MRFISIVTPCFNEEGNVKELHKQVSETMALVAHTYTYEHIFIDNASTDQTVSILKSIAKDDKKVKIIVNNRNFGHIRSPFYGLLQSSGEAVVLIVADLQDPPHLILDFLKSWEKGYKVVKGVKTESSESALMFFIRKLYYTLISKIAEVKLTKNFTGFGLYDKCVIDNLRAIQDPYPYFRGLVSELGYPDTEIKYHQPTRKRGVSANNFYTLYDIAMLGITSHSKIPLRLATIMGFCMSVISFSIAILYLMAKIFFWDTFVAGVAPILIGIFFFASIQLLFVGILGEYVGFIYTQTLKRPLVTEKERVNFQ